MDAHPQQLCSPGRLSPRKIGLCWRLCWRRAAASQGTLVCAVPGSVVPTRPSHGCPLSCRCRGCRSSPQARPLHAFPLRLCPLSTSRCLSLNFSFPCDAATNREPWPLDHTAAPAALGADPSPDGVPAACPPGSLLMGLRRRGDTGNQSQTSQHCPLSSGFCCGEKLLPSVLHRVRQSDFPPFGPGTTINSVSSPGRLSVSLPPVS